MRAEEKWAMRRELEELLGVNHAAAADEQFQKGLNRLKEIIRERDDLRDRLNEILNPLPLKHPHETGGGGMGTLPK
jgi:chromosome segregation ATPase